MTADERDICNYLKSWRGQFVYGRDIARHAGGKWRFREDSEWATAPLARLVERGVIESDAMGAFRIPYSRPKAKKWVAPQIKDILERSSKDFSEVYKIDEDDDLEIDDQK